MKRVARGWTVFGMGALALLATLAWVTWNLIRLEERETEARRETRLHDASGIALWRLDSALAPVWAREAVRAALADLGPTAPEEDPLPFFSWRFEQRQDLTIESIDNDVGAPIPPIFDELDRAFAGLLPAKPLPNVRPFATNNALFLKNGSQGDEGPQNFQYNDFNPRALNRDRAQQLAYSNIVEPGLRPPNLTPFLPVWVENPTSGLHELFLLRRTTSEGSEVQGILLDWTKLREWLLAQVEDLLPNADLMPLFDESAEPEADRLATLPARLEPGFLDESGSAKASSMRATLLISWSVVGAALLAAGLTLRASQALGERRGRFVSAVTHELRTPITTFRMYAQMLADGMVTDEAAKQEYLNTLTDESERLARVVESVLLYSRLEEGGGAPRVEAVEAEDLLVSLLPSLRRRAEESELQLEVDLDLDAGTRLLVDPQSVEQILLNLVDNAGKYASETHDRRLHLEGRRDGSTLRVTLRDHGPGVAANERQAIFKPFRRGDRHEAGAAPGVGLGLALARGLARASGGDLELRPPEAEGAAFRLSLPLRS